MSDSIYRDLRERILAGRLGPGNAIFYKDLQREYACSTSPVAGALRILRDHGFLVEGGPRHFRVTALEKDELIDRAALDQALTTAATRSFDCHLRQAALAQLRTLSVSVTNSAPIDDFVVRWGLFFATLRSASAARRADAISAQLFTPFYRWKLWSIVPHSLARKADEALTETVQLLRQGENDAAVKIVARHWQLLKDAVARSRGVENLPQPIEPSASSVRVSSADHTDYFGWLGERETQ